MVKKTPKKSVKKTVARKSMVKKTATKKRVVKKTATKAVKKTPQAFGKNPARKRTAHCITICGPKKCTQLCFTPKGAFSGKNRPCKVCGHGHFCEDDHECLSCGCMRHLSVKRYKGN